MTTTEPAKENRSIPIQEGRIRVSGKWIILAILLTMWAGIGMWVLTQSSEPQHVPLTYVSGQKAKADSIRPNSVPGRLESDLKIHLELLTASQARTERSFGSPKNIFAPVFPGMSSVPGAAPLPLAANPVPMVPQPTPEELAQQASRRELAQFRYLGYLIREGKEEAFLAKGNILYVTGADRTIDQKVLVKAITPTGVTLHDTSSDVEQVLRFASEISSSAPVVSNTVTPERPVTDSSAQASGQPAVVLPSTIEIPVPSSPPVKTSM